ncbi:hypothetical protein Syun_020720 [Stephania yunnanensis]|uniref:NADP-dependent oxidoreductase domain-containing protein n=1 Tax=Stephania yunnanensis TaxID=152371 RepID=A0AAP0IEF7_9MAGN
MKHFDNAPPYKTEQPLGLAITEALKLDLIKSRDELFITSKLWCCDAHPHLVVPALQKTLKNLGLDYLDLYLIHWPVSSNNPGNYDLLLPKEELVRMDYKSVWAAMEEAHRLGLTKSIGVSNFSCKKLEYLLSIAKVPPAVNQGARENIWGPNRVMESPVLKEIAIARGKTVAQVCLRWVREQGVTLLVKSFNEERMKENLDIFEWELSEEDLEKINEIPQSRGLPGSFFVSDEGSFKSLAELWDGEL